LPATLAIRSRRVRAGRTGIVTAQNRH
jgi:hypothetical protein